MNKNILSIEYNALNLPCEVTFGNGNTVSYLYSAGGTKLRTAHTVGGVSTTTDYLGNVVYENGSPKLLLTDVGYVSLSDGKYHYYLKDHQGNNRVVISSTGTVEEVNHYYPFGGVFASSGNVQPYKYNGKELDREGGLDWYDYGARHYDAALGRFLTRDPLAQKYWQWSPYAYCLDNPVRYVDPDGSDGFDVIVGYGIGFLTNVIPGTGGLRDLYTPTDAADYNNALRGADNASLALGAGLTAFGGGAMLAGETATLTGLAVTAGSAGAASPVALPVAGGGVVLTEAGALTAGAGVMMMENAADNRDDGYERGKKSNVSSGNKNSQHANQHAKYVASLKYKEYKKRYEAMKSKAGKTAEETKEQRALERQMKHWKKKMDDSGENHSRNHKGN